MEFIPDKLKKVLFIIIGICNFIVIPVVLLIFSGKRDWYGILYVGLMSIFFSLLIIVSYRRFTVPKIIANHLIPRNKKSYYIITIIFIVIALIILIILLYLNSDFEEIMMVIGSIWIIWITIIIYLKETIYFKLWW